jgi:flagellar hook-associated protein 2
MAITTLTGLGSGLDIKNLVPALIEAEKAPKQAQINTQKARTDTQLSAVSMLKSALATFESSLLSLKSSSSAFDGYKASSSSEAIAAVTLGAGAVAGSYALKVNNLATSSKVASAVQASTQFAQGGKLTISVGTATPYNVQIADNASLSDIRDAINGQLGSNGISANIIQDSQGSRLVLSSEVTGAGTDITVVGEKSLARLNIGGAASGLTQTTSSADIVATSTFADGSLAVTIDGVVHNVALSSLLQGGETELGLDDLAARLNQNFAGAGLDLQAVVKGEGANRTLAYVSTSGTARTLDVAGSGSLAALAASGTVQSGAGFITQAADASFELDGLALTSKTNTVTSLSGLTIKLQAEGTSTLSVSANTDGIAGSVESFVMAYNTLLTVTNGLTKVTQTTDKDGNPTTQAGALVADSGLRSLMSQIRSALVAPTGSGSLRMLADLGVSTNRDGTLAVDKSRLSEAVKANPGEIKELFTGESGLLDRIGDLTTVYTGTGGLLASREKSLNSTLENLAKDQGVLDRRIEKLTLTLFGKFNAMDNLVARLTATSQSVMATLNALNNKKDD